jgi:uncharacterized protein (TIGR02217 family)
VPVAVFDNFHEIRLPDAIADGAKGEPGFPAIISSTPEGAETVTRTSAQPRISWTITIPARDLVKTEEFLNFWYVNEGWTYGFRFRDYNDYKQTTAVQMVRINATQFQLVKRYIYGPYSFIRPIYKPVSGTIQVWNGATPMTGWLDDTTNGTITFTGGDPGFVPLASFQFDLPMRFDTEFLPMELTHAFRRDITNIALIEKKPDRFI